MRTREGDGTKPGAASVLSGARWTAFDALVGHHRRYEPERLARLLTGCGLVVKQSAAFGMKPRSERLTAFGMWFLVHQRERANWWYNRVGMPLALRRQKPLALREGMIATENVDEVLLLCRKFDTDSARPHAR